MCVENSDAGDLFFFTVFAINGLDLKTGFKQHICLLSELYI